MEYHNKILCVSFSELTDGIVKASTIRQNVLRKNIECVRRGGGEGCEALYAWSSIPEKYKLPFIEKYGDPAKVVKAQMIAETVRLDSSAREFYEEYTYEVDGERKHLTAKLVEEYTINASVLRRLISRMNECRGLRAALGITMGGVWDVVAQSSEKLRESYGHTLPANTARLKEKVKAFKEKKYASLISGKIGNFNTLKITKEFGRLLIALKRSRVPVYTDRQLFEKANEIAAERGWKPIRSLSGLKKWLNSPEVQPLWYDAVHGEQESRQRFNRKHKTALPTRRDSLWYGDGTKLNLYYKDEDGKVRTTCVYEVIDAATEVMLGYHISDTEDYIAQYHALRMAIQTAKHKPFEFVTDNQGGQKKNTSSGFLKKIATMHRPTMPYNGESKTIESIFGRFQSSELHKDWRFTGQNVGTVKKSSRPNVEFLKANKDKLYTLAELKDAYAAARQRWNEAPHPATGQRRIDMYNESVNEETQEVTIYDMVEMFWCRTKQPVTFTDQGITITVKGRPYTYEVFDGNGDIDHEWRRRNTYRRFIVAYDPYDMSSVRLYRQEADGSRRFECTAEEYFLVQRAHQDQTAKDHAFLRKEQEANMQDRIIRQVAARAIEYENGTAPEQHGLSAPRLKGAGKHAQEQIERQLDWRVAKYRKPAIDFEKGVYTKNFSQEDWLNNDDDGGAELPVNQIKAPKIDLRKTAGKI
ncbi:kinase [Alloprevotella tannerae]|uniref:kinase n=1 Tax=Alloprevotella tannerae TaxID=76122 RepID=UPI00288A5976|nr:kinase [Alloprevotella tannerae]